MHYRRLGESGLKVSAVSLGSWLTYGNSIGVDAALPCVKAAWDAGIILFDTADIYDRGESEKCLGESFKQLGLKRRDMVVATKVFWPMSGNPNDRGLSRKHLTESLEGSLERLGMPYVDLYQCHRYDPETPLEELIWTMTNFVRQGRILYWGVSLWDKPQIEQVCALADDMGAVRPISNQPPYSLLERTIEREVIPTCERLGLGQIVYSPLAQGVLTGKYAGGGEPPAGSRAADPKRGQFVRPMMTAENLARVEKLRQVAHRLGEPLSAVAVAFTLSRPNVASAICGATSPGQIEDNVKGASLSLGDDVLDELDKIFPPGRYAERPSPP